MGDVPVADANLDLMKGTLGLLLLTALSSGPRHGHQMMHWIRGVTDEAFRIEEGAIYPALHRLEAKGLVASEWGVSENNRQAKYYRLTAKGRRKLAAERKRWERYVATVAKVLETG